MDGTYENVVLTGLQHADGEENPSGIKEDAWLILAGDFATVSVPTLSTTPLSALTVSANHVLKATKAPIACYTMFEKSDFESPSAGETFSKIFMPVITLFVPQPTPENAANMSILKNGRVMVLFNRTYDSADFIQIGTKGLWAKVTDVKVAFGKGPTGEPGITVTITAPSIHPFYLYTGTLPAPAA